jgi:hyaluronan synthase
MRQPAATERILLLAGSAVLLAALLAFEPAQSRLSVARDVLGAWFPVVAWPAAVSGAVFVLSMAWRVVLWLLYRPVPTPRADAAGLPALTVLVPAYNEGATAGDCVRSILASAYPADRLRVVAIDDGSTDDTARHLLAAAALAPGRVEVVRMARNGGKRAALREGFRRVDTGFVVTVDSDTVLPPDSLRALVAPLASDPRVGAVAGRIEVLNRDEDLLTRMLGVRYRLGFDFTRAYQSVLGSVFVCPGAFTAYRFEAVRDGLDAWLDQRFLGNRCTNGDDHALTNGVLAGGWRTVYQSTAEALTRVPSTYRGLSKMYVRWARSSVREGLLYLALAPRLLRRLRAWPAYLDALAGYVQIPLRIHLMFAGYALLVFCPALLLKSVAAALVVSGFHSAVYLRSERSLDVAYTAAYALFSLLTLQWIYPWAALTVRSSKWLTR